MLQQVADAKNHDRRHQELQHLPGCDALPELRNHRQGRNRQTNGLQYSSQRSHRRTIPRLGGWSNGRGVIIAAMAQPLEVRSPQTDDEWAAYYELRWLVLRAPWNQPAETARDPVENVSEHAVILDGDGRALATGRLHFNSPTEGQLRSMATAEHARGQGWGRQVVEHLEEVARQRGATTIVLNARYEAVGF